MWRYFIFVILLYLLASCSEVEENAPQTEIHPTVKLSESVPLGNGFTSGTHPTISHVLIVDLDQDGRQDVLACDVLGQQVSWIRQARDDEFVEEVILSGVNGAVHVEVIDFENDGDLDVLIAAMGVILPTDARMGQVIILENDGHENFTAHTIAEGVQRVTDVRGGDIDGDGDLDLSVAQFGYTQGQVQWFENKGDWNFLPHQLIDRSGAIHAPIVDIDNDGDLDILALLSQEWETVYAFVNDGKGNFTQTILHDVADADFSSSGMSVVDLDQDGDVDIVWTNGDAFVSVDYRPLPTHGVQWLENNGNLDFTYHRIGQMDGAYGPSIADWDGDGDFDIVTVAEFAFWDRPSTRSVVLWEQQENMQFVPWTVATNPTHLVTCDLGDLDGNGFPDIVVGGMALYPPFDRITRVSYFLNEGNISADATTNRIPQTVQKKVDSALSSGEKGMVLHANGFNSRSYYQIAIKEEPENPRWPYYLGILDASIGDSASALTYFEHAEKLDTAYAPLKTRLGELYVGEGNESLAEEKFRLADTSHATVALAQLAAAKGAWREVIDILKNTTVPAATSLLSTANAKLKNETVKPYAAVDMGYQMNDPWLQDVERLCILSPHLVTQAQTDFISGNVDSAEKLLRRAIDIDGTEKDARLALANILMLSDRLTPENLSEAIVHLEAGLKSDPSYVMTRSKYGWALYLSERFDEAKRVWLAILKDEPMHGPALTYLGQLALQQKQYAQSYEYYTRALSVPDDSPFDISTHPQMRASIYYRMALSAKGLRKHEEAIDALEAAVALVPSDVNTQFELGNLLITLKKFREALPHLEVANALQPNTPRMLAALGYTWFNLGENQNAKFFLEQAVKLAPTFALAWYHLGNAQLGIGDRNAAADSFTVAVQLQPTFTAAKDALLTLNGR
jgi:tetratricopeptide (TPR) repeat protein